MADRSLKHTIQKQKAETKIKDKTESKEQKNTTLITNGPQTRDLHFLPSRLAPFQFFWLYNSPPTATL
jgi:hypothetical protein